MAVTINDVAQVAGVAVGTVSRVLNNSKSVKPSTREKVLKAIAELNYTPDPIARSMITRRTGTLGVVIPFVSRYFSVEILGWVIRTASSLGYQVIIYDVEEKKQRDRYFNELPMRRKVDGVVIVSLAPDDSIAPNLKGIGLPAVLVDAYSPYITSLVVKNIDGAYMAVNHLIKQGHRRIGFINGIIEGNFKFNQANDRLVGVHRALCEVGLEFEPDLMVTSSWDRVGGCQATERLLDLPEPPTAIFAASDVMAAGVLEAARRRNLVVPRDLSVMGFDGIELSEILGLTTIQQPIKQLAELGVTRLMEEIEGADKPPDLIRLDTCLVERLTLAPPPGK